MGIASGGLIQQSIREDNMASHKWDQERTVIFNVQILNSDAFYQVTGLPPPETPINAAQYAKEGLPFFKLYEEKSSVAGSFNGVKSVMAIDKELAKKAGIKAEDEPPIRPDLVVLNPARTRFPFRTVSELKKDLLR